MGTRYKLLCTLIHSLIVTENTSKHDTDDSFESERVTDLSAGIIAEPFENDNLMVQSTDPQDTCLR